MKEALPNIAIDAFSTQGTFVDDTPLTIPHSTFSLEQDPMAQSTTMCGNSEINVTRSTSISQPAHVSSEEAAHLIPTPIHQHYVTTRSKLGVVKPNPKYTHIAATHIPVEPKNVKSALKHEEWKSTMIDEMNAFASNKIWELAYRSTHECS